VTPSSVVVDTIISEVHVAGEVTGNGKEKGIDIGLECKWAADAASQQKAGMEWSGSQ
jgi:hypothetical protein